ncbi:MAG: glutaredoxin family protein [Myxococcaceae bacterium]|nr:glutaredoxin family protein [Myxococcaceae bacterium]
MHVVVYRKPGCPLCDEAVELLAEVEPPVELELRNILERDDWFTTYRYRIPVVVIDGIERLELRFSAQELNAALAAARK